MPATQARSLAESLDMAATQTRLLDCYAAVADATRRMLDAARAADWPALDHSERDCDEWIGRIEALGDPDALLDAQGRAQRLALLRDTLRDDAQLRNLLEPWLGQVDRCLGRPGAPVGPR